jgi:hypothetical protein
MAGDYTGTDQYDSPRYLALVKVPGSAQNLLTKQSIDRYHKTEKWEWKSILLSAAKDQYPASMFVSLKTKVDSIIKAMPAIRESNEVNSILNVYIYENVSDSRYRDLYKADEMGIQVQFIKPLTQTDQQSIDSLTKIYRPGLQNPSTAADASKKFTGALSTEGFSQEQKEIIFADELKLAADKDIKAAFQMLMGTYFDKKNLKSKLTEYQASEIRRLATEFVNAYNAKWDPPPSKPASTGNGTGGSNYETPQQPQPRPGKRVKCSVCLGVGQYEKLMYSHTYDGIYNKVDTRVTKWVVCEVCNGTGWVTKYKN